MEKRISTSRIIKFLWLSFVVGIMLLALFFYAISKGWLGEMPTLEELENPKTNLASEVYSADQVLLGKYYIEDRSTVSYDEISPNMVHALLATEDIRFYEHAGVDIRALMRVVKGVVTGRRAGGGSTITQQLAKNMFPRGERLSKPKMVLRKFQEWVIATQLEYNYTKNEIMAMYLNIVTFGSNTFGIKTAAKTYFSKSPAELGMEEAAILVGMLKAPTYYNPVRNPNNALRRRSVVFSQMKKYNFLTPSAYDSLNALPIDMSNYQRQDHKLGLATYFREHLRGDLKSWCKTHYKADGEPYNLYRDGLKIYTTINSQMQAHAEEAVTEHLGKELQPAFFKHWKNRRFKHPPFYRLSNKEYESIMTSGMKRSSRYYWLNHRGVDADSILQNFNTPVEMRVFSWSGDIDTTLTPMDSVLYYKYFLQVGMMSVEPHTGYVRAYVGGINYTHFQYDHVMVGKRQVGSTFKPFVYASAMQELGYTPCTKVPNVPVTFQMPDGQADYTPKNSDDDKEGEMVTLKWALANSVNFISAYLIKRVGPEKVISTARAMGVKSDIEAVPAICLGTPSLSVYEMVGALATFANKGQFQKPILMTRIEDKNGNTIATFSSEANDALDESTAYLMLSLMQGVVDLGTGRRLRFRYHMNHPLAGKTGTTDNNSDGWFMGLTPDLVTGVWVGAEDRSVHFRSTSLGQGANMALPIWALYMQKVYADEKIKISKGNFERPPGFDIELDCKKLDEESAADPANSGGANSIDDINF
ncbi:MAG: transglycosylase domain-containing protein [Bacteroidales bacterium]|nr:transglycosylase domain-containing protein [Bacteroidales bacterium]